MLSCWHSGTRTRCCAGTPAGCGTSQPTGRGSPRWAGSYRAGAGPKSSTSPLPTSTANGSTENPSWAARSTNTRAPPVTPKNRRSPGESYFRAGLATAAGTLSSGIRADVAADRPLRRCTIRELAAFQAAEDTQFAAHRELMEQPLGSSPWCARDLGSAAQERRDPCLCSLSLQSS